MTWKVKRLAFIIRSYNGSSVVDYVIGSKSMLRNVQYLIVNPLMPHLSDHCHLSFAIKANFVNRDSLETS